MNPSADLYDLAHCLSQSEKRYFRIQSTCFSPQNPPNYLRLFEAVLLQSTYDEEALKLEFKGDPIADHFPSEKHHLTQQILRTMRQYHAGSSPLIELQDLLRDLDFLARKKQVRAVRQMLKKARKLAGKFELYSEWLNLLAFERRYIKLIHRKEMARRLEEIAQEQGEVRHQLDIELDSLALYDQFLALTRRSLAEVPGFAARAEALRAQLKPLPSGASFLARSSAFLGHALYAQLIGDGASARHYQRKNIELWRAHPERIRKESISFQRSIANYLAICRRTKHNEDFEWGLKIMEALPRKTAEEKVEYFINFQFVRLIYLLDQADFPTALSLLPTIETDLQRFQKSIPPSRLITFYYNIATVHFFTAQPTAANRYLQRILNDQFGEVRTDLQLRARWLLVAVQYDLGHLELWEYLSGSLQRAIRRQRKLSEAERVVLRRLKEAYQMGEVRKVSEGENDWLDNESVWPLEELRYWFRARLAGQSLADTYRAALAP